MKRTGPQNWQLQQLLTELKPRAIESKLWRRVMQEVEKPSRQRRTVNMYKLQNYSKDGEIILVPGKVLSLGEITKPLQVAALSFSGAAREKIQAAQGKTLSISELLKQNPAGKKVRILG